MHILELVFSSSWGGLEMSVGVFANKYRDKGHKVIGIFSTNSSMEEVFKSNNIPYKVFKPLTRYLYFYTAWKIKKQLTGTEINIIQVFQSKDLSTAILLKKFLKRGKIIFNQHMDSGYNKKDIFHRWIYNNLDAVICVTERMKINHLQHTIIKAEKCYVIHNGTDLNRFNKDFVFDKHKFMEKNDIPSNRIIIGTIARLDRLKNQKLLIDAASELIPIFNDKIHFIFLGNETDSLSGKNYKNELISEINNKNLEDYFSLFDFTKEVEKFFAILDIFVLTTTIESFGLVLLEAMAMGKPVIASNRGGPREIIDHKVNGFLFDPDNKEELISQLSQLISDKELRITMGEKSIDKVKTKFDHDKKLEEYLEIFRKLC